MKLYQKIASLVCALQYCRAHGLDEMADRHTIALDEIERSLLPSGSGIDAGTSIDIDSCSEDRLVLNFEFHHMNDTGYYVGWTRHRLIVKPSLLHGFTIKITGRDKNGIKEYLADTYHEALNQEVPEAL